MEVKTTDAYVIKTGTLLGYISNLVSEGAPPDEDHALGLYVVGRQDREFEQLENAIIAGNYHRRLRISTVESILSLTELVVGDLISLDEAVTIIRPHGILIDDTVVLLARVAGQAETSESPAIEAVPTAAVSVPSGEPSATVGASASGVATIDIPLGFDRNEYMDLCRTHQARADRYRASKQARGFRRPGGRRAQRAYLDAVRDIGLPVLGYRPVVRVAAPNGDGADAYHRVRSTLRASLDAVDADDRLSN